MADETERYADIKDSTQGVYQCAADQWHKQRSKSLYEKIWLDRFIAALPDGGRILDLGCGTGDPVGRYILSRGLDLVGIDYAPAMIAIARVLFPSAVWHVGDIRDLPDIGTFDGVYSWDGFFHLSVAEQRRALPALSNRVRTGGAMLLTVGTGEGEVTGTVAGETVYHASLSPEEYKQTLKDHGFRSIIFKPEDPDCQGRSVLMASKRE